MEDWSVENPFGAITPYWLRVEGKWRLSAAIAGVFLCEYVTCPFCENQKGLVFESDSSRLGELVDITCPKPCGQQFQIRELTGYDLKQRLLLAVGDDADPAFLAGLLAEDPAWPSGPLPPADEPETPEPVRTGTGKADASPTAAPRMRSASRRTPAGKAGNTPGGAASRATDRRIQETREAVRRLPDDKAARRSGVSGGGRSGGVQSITVVDGDNNQPIRVVADRSGSRATSGGQPIAPDGRVPRKVAAKARRAAREATGQAARLARESGGRSANTVEVRGENNSVITSHSDT